MKIAIMGAGAMGSFYGSYLSQNNEVWAVDIWKDHVNTINEKGLTLKISDTEEKVFKNIKATDKAEDVGVADLVVIFVKSVNTAEALVTNKALFGPDTMVLTLQNGYGNDEDILEYVKAENLFIGTTACGATVLGPGHVFQAGKGITNVGVTKAGDINRAQIIVDLLNECGLEAVVAKDVMLAIWTKLLVNVGLNAPLALLGVRNGFIADSEAALKIGTTLVTEGAAVAKAEGYDINPEDIVQHYYIEGSKVVGYNRCSMLQDVDKKRKTENAKINGAIVRLGKKHGIPTPYNEVLQTLITAKEDSYDYE